MRRKECLAHEAPSTKERVLVALGGLMLVTVPVAIAAPHVTGDTTRVESTTDTSNDSLAGNRQSSLNPYYSAGGLFGIMGVATLAAGLGMSRQRRKSSLPPYADSPAVLDEGAPMGKDHLDRMFCGLSDNDLLLLERYELDFGPETEA